MIEKAFFSDSRKYRYSLTRIWDQSLKVVLFICLNPSTEDEENDDPTIMRCINYAKDWGFGGIVMANLFAFRATDPKDMKASDDPTGPGNLRRLIEMDALYDLTVAAWGNDGDYLGRGAKVIEMIPGMSCLTKTKSGCPGHPLYLKKNLMPVLIDENQVEKVVLGDTTVFIGDALKSIREMQDESVNCVVTSPPYLWQRDYGTDHVQWPEVSFSPMSGIPEVTIQPEKCELGSESTILSFIGHIVLIFREVYRVLKNDGNLWLNFGDLHIKNGTPGGGGPTIGERKLGSNGFVGTYPKRKVPTELKPKNLAGIPWRVAFALQADGWFLRMDNIWYKKNPLPESCKDRCTKSHEYVFHLTKQDRYYYDNEAIKEKCIGSSGNSWDRKTNRPGVPGLPDQHRIDRKYRSPSAWDTGKGSHGSFHKDGRRPVDEFNGENIDAGEQHSGRRMLENMKAAREKSGNHDSPFGSTRNKRSVWTIATSPYKGAHFATFLPKLIELCILAGCPKGGTVLDPFGGTGTTGYVANAYGRKAILCELNPDNVPLIKERLGLGYQEEVEPDKKGKQLTLF